LRDSCRAGYVDVMGKICRISCPTGWVTCGLRPDRGLMCGQSDKDCREAKVEMFSSILSAVGQIAGLVVTAGASSTLAYALKVIEVYDNVKGFIDTLKLFKEDTGLMNKLATYAGGGGVLAAINEIIDTRQKIVDLKTAEDPNNPVKDSDITKYRRRMIAMVAKFVGQDLLALLDPTGVAAVVTAFVKPKCIENTNYMWFDTDTEENTASSPPARPTCASENGNCACSGQVAFGANGKFNFKLSTTTIACTNAVFGDPTPGTVKNCYCLGDHPCASENGNCACSGQVAYGANGKFNFRSSTSTIACTNAVFGGDPIPGVAKKCFCPPPAYTNTKCANENEPCTCFGTVQYGAEGKFTSKTFTDSAFICSNTVFGVDPYPDTVKACYCSTLNAVTPSYNTTVGVNIEGYPTIAADGTDCGGGELGACGGTQTGDATVPDCKNACNQNPNCVGFVSHPYGAMMKSAGAMACAIPRTDFKWWQRETQIR